MGGPRFKDSKHLPHYVYRCYDASGVLLYVGCSVEPVRRVTGHRMAAWWGDRIASVRHTVFPNREKALSVERHTIFTERPICNVKSRWLATDPRTDWTLDDYRLFKTAVLGAANGITHTPMTSRLLSDIDREVSDRFGVTILGGAA